MSSQRCCIFPDIMKKLKPKRRKKKLYGKHNKSIDCGNNNNYNNNHHKNWRRWRWRCNEKIFLVWPPLRFVSKPVMHIGQIEVE